MLRILSGTHKGQKLLPPPTGSETRPITARVKKSLFDMLGGRLAGAAVADLYCGTGSIGLEAISRGARFCWFVERDRKVVARLRRNIDSLGVADRCEVWCGDVAKGLVGRAGKLGGPFDVAFVDPPYAAARRWSWPAAAGTLFGPLAERLAGEGIVVLRVPGGVDVPEALGGLVLQRQRTYGDMVLAMLGRGKAG